VFSAEKKKVAFLKSRNCCFTLVYNKYRNISYVVIDYSILFQQVITINFVIRNMLYGLEIVIKLFLLIVYVCYRDLLNVTFTNIIIYSY